MSEQNDFVNGDATVGKNRKPNRKEPKQISFRVSESEYLKLQQSAETLNTVSYTHLTLPTKRIV